MMFSYDKFSQLEKPTVTLAKPDKRYIGFLKNYDLKTELYFNSISQATFTVHKYENGIKTPHYDEIEVLKLVEIKYVGWFQITQINKVGDGDNERKEVTALSLENELCHILLYSFGEMGIKTDEDGGQDMYCLYNPSDKEHSILHIIMGISPIWTVGHIDEEVATSYHSFTEDSIDAYSFLTGEVSKVYECVFQFDTFDRTISAYKLTNIGQNTSIFLSYRNLINEIQVDEDSADIKTIFNVVGGDYNGNPLVIANVNPTGTNDIINVSYYRNNGWFSKALESKYDSYEATLKDRKETYTNELKKLTELIQKRDEIAERMPSTPNSTNWSEYGTKGLQVQFDKYNDLMSTCLDGNRELDRVKYYNILNGTNGIVANQKARKEEYKSAEEEIKTQEEYLDVITVDTVEFFGTDLYKELSAYFRYNDFIDESYVGKKNMSDDKILQMQQDLLEKANKELAKVCKPKYTITINSQNFPAMSKYLKYTEQLYLGNIATIEFEDDTMVEARLLKIVFDWEDYDNFELVFSSKTKLEDGWFEFAEIQQQASSSATSQAISGSGWNEAKKQNTVVADFMNNAFDAAKNKLFAGKNEEFKIDGTGTLWRKWLDYKNDYSPNQMWGTSNGLYLTDSAWATVDTCIGELNVGKDENGNDIIMYGIAAPLLLGRITITEQLYVFNDSGTYSMTKDGFISENANKTNKLVINPEDNEIFSIYKNSDKVVWFDYSGNAWFKGNITASEITGSKFTATNGTNTITIDPSTGGQLFSISKGSEQVLYFTSSGDAIFKGSLTVGAIFSQNWLTSGGNESGTSQGTQGTFINLTDGTFFFGGEHLQLTEERLRCNKENSYEWMNVIYPETKKYAEITGDYIMMQYATGNINLYMTPRGIATGIRGQYLPEYDYTNAGIIDFYSDFIENGSNGMTLRTNKGSVCLSSAKNNIIINPNDNQQYNDRGELVSEYERRMFAFEVRGENRRGHLKYGHGRQNTWGAGLEFRHNTSKVVVTDGYDGEGTLQCKDLVVNGVSLATVLSTMAATIPAEAYVTDEME